MNELMTIFAELPAYLKLVVAMAVIVPLLTVWSYLNPPKPPPKKPDGTVVMPDGKTGKVYMNDQSFVEKKKR